MARYFIELSYKGTNFNGWQIQPDSPSIQQELQEALSKLLREDVLVVGAGRTDTGVHASFYIAHFDTQTQALPSDPKFVYHLNAILDKDIAVRKIYEVEDTLHARFSAKSREYKYYISTQKNPFTRESTYTYTLPLDIERMQQAANLLLQTTDFTSFAKLHADTKTNICHLTEAQFSEQDNMIVFTIVADRFLRNMVRAIVGTLLEVGRLKMTVEEFKEVIETKNRSAAGSSAAAQGLFLTDIKY